MSQDNASRQASAGADEAAPRGLELELTLLLKGLDSAIPDDTSLVVAGKGVTKADLMTQLQNGLGLFQVVRDQVQALKSGRQARALGVPAVRQDAKNLKAVLEGFFGPNNPQLGQFGIKRRGPGRKLTAAEHALRAAKARATRALRHTMGARQKQAVRATAATLTLGDEAVSSSPAAPASPSSNGTSSSNHAA